MWLYKKNKIIYICWSVENYVSMWNVDSTYLYRYWLYL